MAQFLEIGPHNVEISTMVHIQFLASSAKVICYNGVQRETSDAAMMTTLRTMATELGWFPLANSCYMNPECIQDVTGTGEPEVISVMDKSGEGFILDNASDVTAVNAAKAAFTWRPAT